jgi:competence/damage-inducible protein CinA-like protein
MNAEIITIGTELLLGEIADTNTRVIARSLRDLGLDLFRTTTVGDNLERIAGVVRESLARSQVVITTGGLGPTVDDPTREAIAAAVGVKTEFRPELWEQIQDRFAQYGRTPTENNRRQAYIPEGAIPVENPVGTAPAFIVEHAENCVIALPGVPEEMATLLEQAVIPYLRRRFGLQGVILARLIRTAGMGESALDEHIQDLERLSNPTVGLSAHPGRVDIRITAKADDQAYAQAMIEKIETVLRQRLGEAIYGVDDDTLEAAALRTVEARGWRLTSVEGGTDGALSACLAAESGVFMAGEVLSGEADAELVSAALAKQCDELSAEVGIAVLLIQETAHARLMLILHSPLGEEVMDRSYGGVPLNAAPWAVSMALDLVRRRLS